MRYVHPSLEIEVPIEIRREVYKKALTESKIRINYGLCLLLPVILWDLADYLSENPLGKYWSYIHTPIAFPELTEERMDFINELTREEATERRKIVLQEMLDDVS